MPGLADAAGGEVAVDDRVALVGALRRLVHPLREGGDDPRRAARTARRRRATSASGRPVAAAVAATSGAMARARSRAPSKPAVCVGDEGAVEGAGARRGARAGPRTGRCRCRAASPRNRSASSPVWVRRGSITTSLVPRAGPRVDHAAEQDRVAPGGVRADQHDEVGLVEVLVAARHGVGAEGAPVGRDRARHAEPRIGVDVRRADEALRELVGDVVILGEQLAREVEGDRVRPVLLGDPAQSPPPRSSSAASQRRAGAVDLRVEQAVVEGERLAQRRALGAEPAEIGRMRRGRPRSRRRPARPASRARRSRRRNRGRWSAPWRRSWPGRARSWRILGGQLRVAASRGGAEAMAGGPPEASGRRHPRSLPARGRGSRAAASVHVRLVAAGLLECGEKATASSGFLPADAAPATSMIAPSRRPWPCAWRRRRRRNGRRPRARSRARRRSRACGPGRRSSRVPSRDQASDRRVSTLSSFSAVELVLVEEVGGLALVAEEQPVAARAPAWRARSRRKARNGAMPVPGPTMMTSFDRSAGSAKPCAFCR